MKKFLACALLVFMPCFIVMATCFVGCSSNDKIKMYDISSGKIITLKFEDYVAGATAAEMDESFAMAALETQAVLCRTYAIYFMSNQASKYAGADISNDITEAQAYTSNIPQKVRQAINNTKGKYLTNQQGKAILPYYCSNCGGKNSLANQVFANNNTNYIKQVQTGETEQNSKNYSWQASITKADILYAVHSLGGNLASVNTFKVNKTDIAGRALEFNIGGIIVNSNAFRLAVGSTILKSCFITDIVVGNTAITFSGLGYGHGVGLSQYGANILAQTNNSWQDIIDYYYKDLVVNNKK